MVCSAEQYYREGRRFALLADMQCLETAWLNVIDAKLGITPSDANVAALVSATPAA
jgi:hypothetical protein